MKKCELDKILDKHKKWLRDDDGGERANLFYAYLSGADLSGADLSGANLSGANLFDANLRRANLFDANLRRADLSGADLSYANLSYANLSYANLSRADLCDASLYGANLFDANLRRANLSGANLSYANLSYANLSYANLSYANLSYANLSRADLRGASLYGANLSGANLNTDINKYQPFQICPQEGDFIAWKKGYDNCIVKLLIPKRAKRTSSLVGRKCRASLAKVLCIWDRNGTEIKECYGWHQNSFIYKVGRLVKPDSYDPDIRVECTHGIHFFITKEEAEQF